MTYARNGRNRQRYRRAARRTWMSNPICAAPDCGQPIDTTLPRNHPMAGTADHPIALALGGDLLAGLRPMHRSCNSRRGTGEREPTRVPRRSDAW